MHDSTPLTGSRPGDAGLVGDHYRRIFEGVPIGLFLISPSGVILDVNPALVEMLGHGHRDDVCGRHVADFEIARDQATRCLERLHREGQLRELDIHLGRSDETSRSLRMSVRVTRDPEGRIFGYEGSVEDVTAGMQAEEVLQQSEARFGVFMDHSPLIAFIKDEAGRYVYVNDRCEDVTGLPRSAMEGRSDDELFPGAVAEVLQKVDLEVLEKNVAIEGIELVPNPTGGVLHVMVVKFPVSDGQRRLVGGVGIDISARIRAEEAERDSARRFQELFEHSPDAIVVFDLQGNVLDVNSAATRLFDLGRVELIARSVTDLVPPGERANMSRDFSRLARGEIAHLEGMVLGPEGRAVPVAIRASHVDNFGQRALLIHARDMTQQRSLQEQFLRAQKMEAVGRLAGGVAHDFNNLLTAIIGYSGLIQNHPEAAGPVRQYAGEVDRAAHRAADLVRQLMAFSRKQSLEMVPVDLNSVIENVDSMMRRLVGDHIELVTEPGQNLGMVKADPGQLEQVIANLIVNARDAMPTGGKLTIRTQNCSHCPIGGKAPGDHVCLSITDTGLGISDEVKEHIFEPFFTTKGAGKGTGLGLATCYGIIEQTGGQIVCRSEVGVGTTFEVWLPRCEEEAPMLPLRPNSGSLPTGTERILLVEDEEGVRSLGTEILTMLGYEVQEAIHGEDALEILSRDQSRPFNLLMTDVMMPQMGGAQLAQRFRVLHPGIPILFNSGAIDDEAGLDGLLANGNAWFLPKPFTLSLLACKVREVLDRSR